MSFDAWANDLADSIRDRYDSSNPEHVRRMFACRTCGAACPSSPGYGQAVCENCCEDHDYDYNRDLRTRTCRHCEKPVDPDWYND